MLEPIGGKVFVDEGQTSKLYYVRNSNDRKLMVLAQNRATALNMAIVHNHIKTEANARIHKVNPDNPKPHEDKFFASVRAAIRDGRQGVLRDLGGFAVVGDGTQAKTYTPIVEVKSK